MGLSLTTIEILAYPDVELRTLVLLTLEDLRRGVRRAAAPGGQRLPRLEEVPEAKIWTCKTHQVRSWPAEEYECEGRRSHLRAVTRCHMKDWKKGGSKCVQDSKRNTSWKETQNQARGGKINVL